LELPKEEHRLPANYLSEIEVELLLNQTEVKTPLGIRDRAILETLYSSAIRRNESLNLSVYDVDRNRRLLTIRQGKGKRDRVVPIGVRAWEWLEKYIVDVRYSYSLQFSSFVQLTAYNADLAPEGGKSMPEVSTSGPCELHLQARRATHFLRVHVPPSGLRRRRKIALLSRALTSDEAVVTLVSQCYDAACLRRAIAVTRSRAMD
jgi:integrase